MFFKSPLLSPLPRRKSREENAWEDHYYETYCLNIELPAARLHSTSRRCSGSWFAVDLYDVSIADYHNLMALVNQKGKPWFFKRPDLDRYILLPGSIVNVGIAKQQGFHEGGGLQFEFVSGSAPYLLEHVKSPKQVRF